MKSIVFTHNLYNDRQEFGKYEEAVGYLKCLRLWKTVEIEQKEQKLEKQNKLKLFLFKISRLITCSTVI